MFKVQDQLHEVLERRLQDICLLQPLSLIEFKELGENLDDFIASGVDGKVLVIPQ